MRRAQDVMPLQGDRRRQRLDRRDFLGWAGRRGLVIGLAGSALAACGDDDDADAAAGPATTDTTAAPETTVAGDDQDQGRPIVGDVIEYALTSDEWSGPFGFALLRLHRGVVDGGDTYYIRTDASDQAYAEQEGLVFVPKLAALGPAGLAGDAYLVSGGTNEQATVLSSQPGRDDYTPAWRIHQVTWQGTPTTLASVADVEAARDRGEITVEETDVVLNAAVVKWSDGELPVDAERTGYLGPGQLLEPPDTSAMTVRFKLHECFPAVRYIVTDTSLAPMAGGMNIVHSPRLAEAPEAGGTGRINVFMNGIEGSGPMGFQPSVFDSPPGDAAWSPYWDHITYAWKEGTTARVLTTEDEVHAARDAGELDEFPGTPDTNGAIFTVNCPTLVLAPNTFTP